MEVLRPTDIPTRQRRRPSLAKRILMRARSTNQQGISLPTPETYNAYPDLHLLSLPGEIRNHIYSFIFHPEDERTWLGRCQIDPHFSNGLTFLRTCRIVYHEAHEMAWAGLTPLISPYEHQYKFCIPEKPSRVTTTLSGIKARGSSSSSSSSSMMTTLPQHSIARVTVQQYLFWAVYPWWLLEKQGQLRPKEIIFQYCLCTKMDELIREPGKSRSVLDSFDSAARGVTSLQRIIVYTCGNLGDFSGGMRFPECFKGVESLALQSYDRFFLRPIADDAGLRSGSMARSDVNADVGEEGEDQSSPVPDEEELWKTTNFFHLIKRRDARSGEAGNLQHIVVEFISSYDVCGLGCVRDRGIAVESHLRVRNDSVTRQSTLSDALRSFSIGGSRKDSVSQRVQH